MVKLLTTADIRKITGWSLPKIRALCQSGKLPAINTSTGKRPMWEVPESAFLEFVTPEAKRETVKAVRRHRLDANVPKVF